MLKKRGGRWHAPPDPLEREAQRARAPRRADAVGHLALSKCVIVVAPQNVGTALRGAFYNVDTQTQAPRVPQLRVAIERQDTATRIQRAHRERFSYQGGLNVLSGESAEAAGGETVGVDKAQAPRVPRSSGHAKTPLHAYKAHAESGVHGCSPFH